MDYALKERIGKPELFTGRKEELAFFLKWITDRFFLYNIVEVISML
jgi:hypothetical protein